MARHARGLICLSLTRERCGSSAGADGAATTPRSIAPISPCRSRRPKASPPASRPTTARIPSAPRCGRMRSRGPHPARPHLPAAGAAWRRARPAPATPKPRSTWPCLRAWSRPACWSRSCARTAHGAPAGAGGVRREHGLKIGTIADLIRHRLQTEHTSSASTNARSIPITARSGWSPIATASRASCTMRWCAARIDKAAARTAGARACAKTSSPTSCTWRRDDLGLSLSRDALARDCACRRAGCARGAGRAAQRSRSGAGTTARAGAPAALQGRGPSGAAMGPARRSWRTSARAACVYLARRASRWP
jgi:3,4-dihydroxy 2-butanone 4-phosphate synthase/GTP cyclohydrolase II